MKSFNKILRYVFFSIVVKFIALFIIGINIRHREKLPKNGPAIIVANHNSHLDTLVLINLFSLKLLPSIHPVAAADYFLKNKFIAWFAREIIGIIPISRQGAKKSNNPLIPCYQALDDNQLLILFPEGTRGEPEHLAHFKKGISYLAEKYPHIPVIPIFMHGLGKSLPKGEWLLVPFFCDIFVGDSLFWQKDRDTFMKALTQQFDALISEGNHVSWE